MNPDYGKALRAEESRIKDSILKAVRAMDKANRRVRWDDDGLWLTGFAYAKGTAHVRIEVSGSASAFTRYVGVSGRYGRTRQFPGRRDFAAWIQAIATEITAGVQRQKEQDEMQSADARWRKTAYKQVVKRFRGLFPGTTFEEHNDGNYGVIRVGIQKHGRSVMDVTASVPHTDNGRDYAAPLTFQVQLCVKHMVPESGLAAFAKKILPVLG